MYSSKRASILGINSEFHFSADGYNAFTESIAPQSLRFAVGGVDADKRPEHALKQSFDIGITDAKAGFSRI